MSLPDKKNGKAINEFTIKLVIKLVQFSIHIENIITPPKAKNIYIKRMI